MAGNDAVGEFKEVEFEDRGNDGDFIAFEDLAGDDLARIDAIAKMVCGSKGDVDDPDAPAGFVAFEVRIICLVVRALSLYKSTGPKRTIVKKCKDSRHNDGNSFSVITSPSFQIHAKCLL